eukprot:g50864.t1
MQLAAAGEKISDADAAADAPGHWALPRTIRGFHINTIVLLQVTVALLAPLTTHRNSILTPVLELSNAIA